MDQFRRHETNARDFMGGNVNGGAAGGVMSDGKSRIS